MIGGLLVAVVAGAGSLVAALTGSGDAAPGTSSSSSAVAGARLDDADAANAFLAAASSDVVAVTTYDYRRLDDARTTGLSVTTGAYRKAYQQAFAGSLASAAQSDQVVHDFEVLDTGIGSMRGGGRQAKVLVFGRQTVTDRQHPKGQSSIVTLCATMQRVGSRYLIADLSTDADPGAPPGNSALTAAISAGRTTAQQRLGAVTALAVKSVASNAVTLLVAAESRSARGGTSTGRYALTVVESNGRWAASQLQPYPTQ